MAVLVTTVDEFRKYMRGVMYRSDHHAQNVLEIILALAGAVLWRSTGEVYVYTRLGKMTNVLWFTIGKNEYAVSYDHETDAIKILEGTTQGNVLRTFDNSSMVSDVYSYFKDL